MTIYHPTLKESISLVGRQSCQHGSLNHLEDHKKCIASVKSRDSKLLIRGRHSELKWRVLVLVDDIPQLELMVCDS